MVLPHCVESSTRNWNLKTHIKRKHNGAGNPIQKTGFTYDPRRNSNTSPFPMFKNKMHEYDKTNPFADTREFVRNWSDLLTDFGKLNNQIALNSGNPLAFSAYPFTNLLSAMPDPQMSLRSAFGFRAQPCYACLSLGLVPVFYPDDGHNLPQFTHSCNPFNSQPKIFKNLEDYSPLLLKDVAIQTGFINLIAIPLSEPHQEFLMLMNPRNPKKPLVLTFSNESKIELDIDDLTGHWLERAITTGKEKLSEEQLLEFFWLGPWATFGFFNIKTAFESYHYFMALTDTDCSRMYGEVI